MWGACGDHIFRLWDLRTGTCVREIDTNAEGQIPKCISIGTRFLFSCLGDTIERWNLESGVREAFVRIKAPEPFEEDPLRRQRRKSKTPPVFTEWIALPPQAQDGGHQSETDLFGKSGRHGIYTWDFRADPRGAYMRWPIMLDEGKDTVFNMLLPPTRKSGKKRLWISGERTEHRGRELYVEEHDPVRREKLRSWRIQAMPMSMCVVTGESGRLYVGTAEGMVTVWDVSEEEKERRQQLARAGTGEQANVNDARRIVRERRDIYG
jgi:hypothetical protein